MSKHQRKIETIVTILQKELAQYKEPAMETLIQEKASPFQVLIGTILSLRTKDTTTLPTSRELFKHAKTPEEMLKLSTEEIQKIIYPVGFYRRKSETIHKISRNIIEKHDGSVPDTLEELLKLPGVGRKTANLVLAVGFGKPGLAVDTHVHRISNRLGLVKTKNAEKTEFALREIIPITLWSLWNPLLVTHGQNICTPISPKCSICPISTYCHRIGVEKSR